MDVSQLQEVGLFEMFLPLKPEHKEAAVQLVHWLDQYIDEALIRKYIDAASIGDLRALMHMRSFMQRKEV